MAPGFFASASTLPAPRPIKAQNTGCATHSSQAPQGKMHLTRPADCPSDASSEPGQPTRVASTRTWAFQGVASPTGPQMATLDRILGSETGLPVPLQTQLPRNQPRVLLSPQPYPPPRPQFYLQNTRHISLRLHCLFPRPHYRQHSPKGPEQPAHCSTHFPSWTRAHCWLCSKSTLFSGTWKPGRLFREHSS